jgi:hypothetical protein
VSAASHFAIRAAVVLAGVTAVSLVAGANGPRFYPDDPILVDNDRVADASGVEPTRVIPFEEYAMHTVKQFGDRRDIAAMNTNTLDEVPDSSWFTNRLSREPRDAAAIARGPDRVAALSIDGWPIVEGKGEGLQPGFRVRDPEGHLYQVKFDPRRNPEMSTAAEVIGTAFFHAFGYNVADVYLVEFDPSKTSISEGAVIRHGGGRERSLVKKDIDDVMIEAAQLPSGKYRGVASRFIDGVPLGEFRYWGTRPDDPNDIVPHEHRRELRAIRAFAAWLNHDEAQSTNTLDVLLEADGRGWVAHYLLDFGSLLGSDTIRPQRGRSGNEYLLEWAPGLKTAATFGFYLRPWLRVDYPDVPPSIGRFEGDFFDPVSWRPVYPNPAFDNMRPEDAFWAARIMARIDVAAIRAVVDKARYTDSAATTYMVDTLVKRRDKVLRAWLTGVNPIVDVSLAGDATLTFRNAAVQAGVASAPAEYRLSWFEFDNATATKTPVGEPASVKDARATMPTLRVADGGYAGVSISTRHPEYPSWAQEVDVFFRRAGGGWQTVGIDRRGGAR